MCVCGNNRTVHVQQAAWTDWSLLISHLAGHAPRIEGHLMWSSSQQITHSDGQIESWIFGANPPDPADGSRSYRVHPKKQGAMFAYELKPRLRIGISQNVGSPLFGSVFYIPAQGPHQTVKEKNVQYLRRRQQLRSCHTFASQLLGESDRPSQPFTIRSRDMLQKHAKTTQPQNQSARPGCRNTSSISSYRPRGVGLLMSVGTRHYANISNKFYNKQIPPPL